MDCGRCTLGLGKAHVGIAYAGKSKWGFFPSCSSISPFSGGRQVTATGRGSENGCKKLSQNSENEDHVAAVTVQPQKNFEAATTSLNITASEIMASKI